MKTNETENMRLRILLPTDVLVDTPVHKVIAEAENGSFCLLPHHIDFVSALTPGVLSYWTTANEEEFAAVDEGILVKCAHDVFVSTYNAVQHSNLDHLEGLVRDRFLQLSEHDRRTRSALARLEAGTLRGFHQLQELTFE